MRWPVIDKDVIVRSAGEDKHTNFAQICEDVSSVVTTKAQRVDTASADEQHFVITVKAKVGRLYPIVHKDVVIRTSGEDQSMDITCVKQRIDSIIAAEVENIQYSSGVSQDVVICTADECQVSRVPQIDQQVRAVVAREIQKVQNRTSVLQDVVIGTSAEGQVADNSEIDQRVKPVIAAEVKVANLAGPDEQHIVIPTKVQTGLR